MDQKQQIAEKLKQANNILVTVSNSPSVDQLAACIGLALALNKLGKHATAVFSGTVPSTIEFLKPEETLEDNVDSLRDFIISLDKSKADKLRYKVEDKVVKIFITPYRSSISDKDLEFSQGDFNVDAVVALGVQAQADIDQAIAAHGRILHDATVVTINTKPGGEFGSINLVVPGASSLCELVAGLIDTIDKQVMEPQIATALLTGIVAETERFSNQKTTPATMSVSASLMAAGANQQLVVAKLEEVATPPAPAPAAEQTPVPAAPSGGTANASPGELSLRQASGSSPAGTPSEGSLSVKNEAAEPQPASTLTAAKPDDQAKPVASLEDLASSEEFKAKEEPKLARIHIDEQGALHSLDDKKEEKEGQKLAPTTDPTIHMGGSRLILQPPSATGGSTTGDAYSDPLTSPNAADPAAEQPSGAPAPPPATSSPFLSPASASITPPPSPFMPSSMTPGPIGPPAPSAPVVAPVVGPSDPQGLAPAPAADSARSAVAQAFDAAPSPSSPPDLNVPLPADAPLPTPNPSMPTPVGPPPPVPPPMLSQ